MSELYLRKVILDIFLSFVQIKRIENLRISFECEKTSESNPNSSEIRVYNLKEETRSLIEGDNIRVQLSSGYLGLNPNGILSSGLGSSSSVETIFVGDINKVTHKKDGQDIITTIEVLDGGNRYINSRIEKGYPPNTSFVNVINDLINESGLSKGVQIGLPSKKYANGISLTGQVKNNLDTLCEANDLEWSIQNESIQIIPRKSNINTGIIVLNSKTGLIGIPEKTDQGVEFKTLLMPSILPGKTVKIESKFINGLFKIQRVDHVGDTRAGVDFVSSCEASKQ